MCAWIALLLLGISAAQALQIGPVRFENTPSWVNARQTERLIDRVQAKLEWDLRPSRAIFHSDPHTFSNSHDLGAEVVAFAQKSNSTIHLGPQITAETFEGIFAHELVHLIVGQKYKRAIPEWLEEGLANYVGGRDRVDYVWLASQKRPKLRELRHPFASERDPMLHYMMSNASVALLASKCSFADLLQLSVGKTIESFLSTYCGISNLDEAFDRFVSAQARVKP